MMSSIDALLSRYAKHIKPGETVSFTLIKGPTTTSNDPLDHTAPTMKFPSMAKFGVSVEKPDLAVPLRMFEQKVPEAKDDSDDEEFSTMTQEAALTARKKRRKRKRPPRRQWILEPESEFRDEIGLDKKKKQQQDADGKKIKLRYEGAPEYNASSYILLSVHPNTKNDPTVLSNGVNGEGMPSHPAMSLSVTPVNGFHTFQQPSKSHTLSMQEAENMINDQRATMTRYMMHAKAAAAGNASAPMAMVRPGAPKTSGGLTRARLLGKLNKISSSAAQAGEEDDDDIMSDLKFKSRKKGVRARQELITTLGDGLAVDDDGVLGGANDRLFGGRRNFGRVAQATDRGSGASAGAKANDEEGGKNSSKGASNDGMAMADDFYQRDVGAEYDELDFDANEQFDDDDVDQMEQAEDGGGYVNDDDDDDLDDEEDEDGVAGLASVAGLKALMAKAGGENTNADDKANPVELDTRGRKKTAYNNDTSSGTGGEDGAANATKGGADQSSEDEQQNQNQPGPRKKQRVVGQSSLGNQGEDALGVDAQGNRIISLESVRREIWLHHGQIKTKQLLKIFNVKKRSPEQKKFFNELVKELCTMSKTVEGNMLVLKQHYAK
jgi:hypothetical protein